MKHSWYEGQDPKQKAEIREMFDAASGFRAKLKEMLGSMAEDQLKQGRSKQKYSDPNWAYFQADTNGYNRCLDDVKKLLE
jgi:hypothetical protein